MISVDLDIDGRVRPWQPVEAIDERTYEKSARRHMSSSPRHSFNRDLGVLSFPSGVQPSAEAALASCARE